MYAKLNNISKIHGDCFYLLNSQLFEENYLNMLKAFRNYYEDTHIAYSYKTNYLPKLCKIVDKNGGYAEIVSEMEWWLTKKIGVDPEKVFYNGPYKKMKYIEEVLCAGGHINLDSLYEVNIIKTIASRHPDKKFCIGLRANADIGQEISSRFGMNVFDGTLKNAIMSLKNQSNISIAGLHIHLPFRSLDSFIQRIDFLKKVVDVLSYIELEYVSVGGGYMGAMDEELAKEFSFSPPSYDDYAKIVAGGLNSMFANCMHKPKLIIEPGSAIVANTMKLVTRVVDIKHSRDRYIATLTGSTYNMNPTVKDIQRSIKVYSEKLEKGKYFGTLDMAGFTCIEGDYLYKGYKGKLDKGDFVVFNNVGSYSIVMKPPFILPDIPILDISNDYEVVKKAQSFWQVFEDMV